MAVMRISHYGQRLGLRTAGSAVELPALLAFHQGADCWQMWSSLGPSARKGQKGWWLSFFSY